MSETRTGVWPAPPRRTGLWDYNAEFTAAYTTYHRPIFAFIYGRLRNPEVAKDLTSEVFERAYAKGHQLREPAAYRSWLFTVARNVIASHYRQAFREEDREKRLASDLVFHEPEPDPAEIAIHGDRVSRLMSYVRMLPEREQEILSLKFDAELTSQEIGEVIGITALNVRVAVFRALRRLKAEMGHLEFA